MQEKRKRSKVGIVIAGVAVVLMVVLMVVWQQYEARHKRELQTSLLTTDTSKLSAKEEEEPRQEVSRPVRVIPDDPEKILVMAEEALEDKGYFETNYGGRYSAKGFHVYFLLKKCLDCDGDPGKVEVLAKRLRELSDQDYGPWRVEREHLTELDEMIGKAKQM